MLEAASCAVNAANWIQRTSRGAVFEVTIAPRFQARGETEAEILQQAAAHAKRDHGVTEIDAATLAKVKAAIRPA
jgi:predicted small metal-binding protein